MYDKSGRGVCTSKTCSEFGQKKYQERVKAERIEDQRHPSPGNDARNDAENDAEYRKKKAGGLKMTLNGNRECKIIITAQAHHTTPEAAAEYAANIWWHRLLLNAEGSRKTQHEITE